MLRHTLLAAALTGATSATVFAQSFQDDFDGPTLNARWQWMTPADGPTYSLTDSPGFLRVTVPQRPDGYNHWVIPDGRSEAPMLLAEIPECDFTLEARVTLVDYGEESNFHVGPIAAVTPGNVLCWGPFYGPAIYDQPEPQVWAEHTGFGRLVVDDDVARDVWLRLERAQGCYAFSVRHSEEGPWRTVGTRVSLFPPKYVGLLGKTFGAGPAVVFDVDFVRFTARAPDQSPFRARIDIDASDPGPTIDPMIYGHFIEHIGQCIYGDGIWAEKLRGRKFAGNAGPDGALPYWRRWGPEDGVELARDNVTFYTGEQSQRITSRAAQGEHGIAQDGIEARPITYHCRLVLRQEGVECAVRAALRRGDTVLASHDLPPLVDEWETFSFDLAVDSAGPASFSITTDQADGTLWVGAASLMPDDAVEGMRRDIVEAIRGLQPPIIRWPGGNFASGYHWQDGLGDRDLRPARFDRAWGVWETNDLGIHEYIRLCRLVDCEPYVCLNLGEATADEAAAWVEYCNGPIDTRWGAVRARNGSAEPFDIKYWGLGNELYGDWQLGHLTPENYAAKANEFAEAVRAVDPEVLLVGVGVEGRQWNDWNAVVMDRAAGSMDYLAVHLYQEVFPSGDPELNYMLTISAPERFERSLEATARIAERYAGGPVPLAVDEWNVMAKDAWNGRYRPETRMREALFVCRMFNAFHRLGDRVRMANIALLVNAMGVIQADQTRLALTPAYLAFDMYGRHTGDHLVPSEVTPVDPAADAVLDVSATRSADGATLYVHVVNVHLSTAVEAEIDVGKFGPEGDARVAQLTGPGIYSGNPIGGELEVGVTETGIPLAEALTYSFPPCSATILIFER